MDIFFEITFIFTTPPGHRRRRAAPLVPSATGPADERFPILECVYEKKITVAPRAFPRPTVT